MYIGKISNDECSILLKTLEEKDNTNTLNCFNDEEDSCLELDRNTLIVDSYAYDNWDGFNSPGEVDREQATATDGSIVTLNQNRYNKELIIAAKFCKCDCWNEKIGCLFNDCCNDNITTFEFLNSCGKWLKVQIDLNGFEFEDFETNCGYINILAQENRQKYIYESDVYVEHPTYTNKYDTVKVCDDCINECYTIDKWNATKKICFNSASGKIVFRPQEAMENFTLIWNNAAARVDIDLQANDVIEIEKGIIYLNGVQVKTLASLGINFISSTTANGIDCVTIQTPNKQGVIGVIDYKQILTCNREVWGVK